MPCRLSATLRTHFNYPGLHGSPGEVPWDLVVPSDHRGRPVLRGSPVLAPWSSAEAMFIQLSSCGRPEVHGRLVVPALRSSRGPWSSRGSSRGILVAVPFSMVVPGSPVVHGCAFVCDPLWPYCGRKNVVPRSFRVRTGVAVLLWSVVVQCPPVAHGRLVLRDPSSGPSLVGKASPH